MTDLTLTVSRTIAAPPEAVFNAWLDAEKLAKFMLPAPGMSNPRVTADGRKGGQFEILMPTPDGEIPHTGEFLEVDPHSRLVFSWNSPFSGEGSTVTLSLTPQDAGTHIELTHVKFPSAESRDNHEKGWGHILEALDALVGGA